jgi:hypothetical protein
MWYLYVVTLYLERDIIGGAMAWKIRCFVVGG